MEFIYTRNKITSQIDSLNSGLLMEYFKERVGRKEIDASSTMKPLRKTFLVKTKYPKIFF